MSAQDIASIIGALGMALFMILMVLAMFSKEIIDIIREIKKK